MDRRSPFSHYPNIILEKLSNCPPHILRAQSQPLGSQCSQAAPGFSRRPCSLGLPLPACVLPWWTEELTYQREVSSCSVLPTREALGPCLLRTEWRSSGGCTWFCHTRDSLRGAQAWAPLPSSQEMLQSKSESALYCLSRVLYPFYFNCLIFNWLQKLWMLTQRNSYLHMICLHVRLFSISPLFAMFTRQVIQYLPLICYFAFWGFSYPRSTSVLKY